MLGLVLPVSTLILAFAAATRSPGGAPEEPEPAALWGSVTAPDGARLPGAALVLEPLDGPAPSRTASGPQGRYRFAGLAPGRYELRAHLMGFATWRRAGIELGAGESRQLEVRLRLDSLQEMVEVVAPHPSDSVEAAALREGGARDVAEAIADLGGVTAKRRGALGADVVVRGLQGADVDVQVDGQRICGACPGRMDPPAFHVDFGEIERIEVTRGPFDVRRAGGLGGSVRVITQRLAPGAAVRPSLSLGSAGHLNPVLVAAWGGKPLSVLGGVSYRHADSYRDGAGRPVIDVADYRPGAPDRAYRMGTAWGQVLHFDHGRALQLHYARQRADNVLYPGLRMDAIDDDTDRAQLTHETAYTKIQLGAARVAHWMTDEFRTTGTAGSRPYSMGTRAEAVTLGGRWEWRRGGLSVGAEVGRRTWDISTELAGLGYRPQASLADASSDTLGVFVLLEKDLTLRWGLSAGLRLDEGWMRVAGTTENEQLYRAFHGSAELRRTDLLPAARLGLTWRPRSGMLLTALVGHAARLPEPSERYFALRRAGTDWVGNPGLRPSRNTGVDVSGRFELDRLRLEAALFANAVSDHITVVERERRPDADASTNARARTWDNVAATLWGGELRASLLLPRRSFLDLGLSYVRGRQAPDPDRGLTSGNLPEVPPLRGSLALRYDDGERWLRLEARGAARQDHVNADLQEEPTAGWLVLDASGGLRWRRLSLTVGVVNALDRLYHEHLSFQRDPFRSGARLPEPGRIVFVNASARF